jgi:hypothetical protein
MLQNGRDTRAEIVEYGSPSSPSPLLASLRSFLLIPYGRKARRVKTCRVKACMVLAASSYLFYLILSTRGRSALGTRWLEGSLRGRCCETSSGEWPGEAEEGIGGRALLRQPLPKVRAAEAPPLPDHGAECLLGQGRIVFTQIDAHVIGGKSL